MASIPAEHARHHPSDEVQEKITATWVDQFFELLRVAFSRRWER